MLLGGIEGGGTKFRCAVSTEAGRVGASTTIPTTTPTETLARVSSFFRAEAAGTRLRALGVASFGPIDLQAGSRSYGHITSTPKSGWQDVDLVGYVSDAISADAVTFDTDVNAAATAEYRWGAGRGVETLAYVTVGTGIGAGLLIEGRPLHGLIHPEFGHIRIPHDQYADPFPGCCPNHGDCLEGLASGQAFRARSGKRAEDLPADDPIWTWATHYLSLGLINLICIASPQRIIVGGGVSRGLAWDELRARVSHGLGSYLRAPQLAEAIESYLVPPTFGHDAGLLGALAMAESVALGDRPAA